MNITLFSSQKSLHLMALCHLAIQRNVQAAQEISFDCWVKKNEKLKLESSKIKKCWSECWVDTRNFVKQKWARNSFFLEF